MTQARNQEFCRAGEVSWKEDASFDKQLYTTHQRKIPQGLEVFRIDALKTAFQMRHLTIGHNQGIFPKTRTIFSDF